jgi:flagellar FliL protein
MAIEETEVDAPEAAAVGEAKSGSLLKAAGTVIGLFLMLLITQLAAPILGCKFLNSATPNCPTPEVVVEEAKAKDAAKPKGPPLYLALDPPLVVSLEDKGAIRFLQVTVELMSRDEQVITNLKTHMPVIRNNLLMLLGGQSIPALTNREEKEKLRQDSLAEVRKVMKNNPGKDKDPGTVEDVYFTSFVVQ